MQRIAPNNQFPATHFIEVWRDKRERRKKHFFQAFCKTIDRIDYELLDTPKVNGKTIAIFRIRENKLPTLHNFNK